MPLDAWGMPWGACRARRFPRSPFRAAASRLALDPRTERLLEAPIAPMLLRLAWPNIAVMLVTASTGLIETWWVSRLGLDALAGVALVFPGFMMMQMLSAGAMGGGISSAVARALGGGRRDDADALVLHAIIINVAIGGLFAALVLWFGPVTVPGARGRGRLACRGARLFEYRLRRLAAGLADECAGKRHSRHRQHAGAGARGQRRGRAARAALAVPDLRHRTVSGARHRRRRDRGRLDHGADRRGPGPLSRLGSGGRAFRLGAAAARLFADILRVGAVASVSTLQTTLTVVLATGLVGRAPGRKPSPDTAPAIASNT